MKKLLVIISLLSSILLFIKCSGDEPTDAKSLRGAAFAGSATCVNCHKDLSNSYVHNSHFKTSSPATDKFLKSTITIPQDSVIVYTSNERVIINKKNEDFYQDHYNETQQVESGKMDLAFGSGEKAQTYGYWKDDQLFELPATYFTPAKTWTNSPGFPIDHPYYTRVIPSRCMECHTSFALARQTRDGNQLQLKEVFDRTSIIYGIDCERCHGPAAAHVEFQQEHPEVKQAKFITSIRSLTRQQQLDICGICHAGDPVKLKSIFNFVPGDTLTNYYLYFDGANEPDVHGMQLQLLRTSRCFKETTTLTCNTCHSPHGASKPTAATCISCHQQVKHTGTAAPTNADLANNTCITCHMPQRASKSLDFAGPHNFQYLLRTHRIAVYPKNEWK